MDSCEPDPSMISPRIAEDSHRKPLRRQEGRGGACRPHRAFAASASRACSYHPTVGCSYSPAAQQRKDAVADGEVLRLDEQLADARPVRVADAREDLLLGALDVDLEHVYGAPRAELGGVLVDVVGERHDGRLDTLLARDLPVYRGGKGGGEVKNPWDCIIL